MYISAKFVSSLCRVSVYISKLCLFQSSGTFFVHQMMGRVSLNVLILGDVIVFECWRCLGGADVELVLYRGFIGLGYAQGQSLQII